VHVFALRFLLCAGSGRWATRLHKRALYAAGEENAKTPSPARSRAGETAFSEKKKFFTEKELF
jgi:hypothetical protein